MKFTELKNLLTKECKYSVFLLVGENVYYKKLAEQMIKSAYISEEQLNCAKFNGEDLELSSLVSSLYILPFLSDKRITIVNEFYPTKKDIESCGLKDYLEKPTIDSILVVVNNLPCDAFKNYSSILTVECDRADSNICIKFIENKFKENDITISQENAKCIAEYCLFDLQRIDIEVQKLSAYLGYNGEVNREIIMENISRDTEFKIYELTDYIGKKKVDMALFAINELLSKGDTYQQLLTSMYNYFRRLMFIKISGKTDDELATYFKIKPFAVQKMREQTKYFSPKSLKVAVDTLIDADYKYKSGAVPIEDEFFVTLFDIMVGV